MNKRLLLIIALGITLLGVVALLKYSSFGTTMVWNFSDGGRWLFPLLAISAVIDSVNPCAFSMLLLTIAFLLSIGQARSRILALGGFYILGIFTAYFLIGLGLLQTLHIFNTPHFMGKLGSGLLVLLGTINLIGYFFPAFPIKLRIPAVAHTKMAELMEQTSLPAAFLLGGLVGLCEFPCTGGPYLMALGLLHDNATYYQGVGYLLLYNLIFVLPLIIILAIASDNTLLQSVRSWQQKESKPMRLYGGLAMVALGIIIFFL